MNENRKNKLAISGTEYEIKEKILEIAEAIQDSRQYNCVYDFNNDLDELKKLIRELEELESKD